MTLLTFVTGVAVTIITYGKAISKKPRFFAICRDSLGIAAHLKSVVKCYLACECTMDVVREHTKHVRLQESVVDTNEWDLTNLIFLSSALGLSQKIHSKQCTDTILEVSNRAEDAADQVELVTLKRVA